MKLITVLAFASLLTGCVTIPSNPYKRPLNAESIEKIGKAKVVLAENVNGVEKSWFRTDSSAAGASYGLLGALVTGVMDAIINAGPARRAQQAANEIAELVAPEDLNTSLLLSLQTQPPPASGISIGEAATEQKILKPSAINDAVELTSSYTLSEDASAFRFIATARYQSSTLNYVSPYKHEKAPPKTELTGPIYRNTFTYQSAQLPIPTLTPDLKDRLVASIQASYQTAGAPPAPDSDDAKALAKELEAARDDKLTKDEIAIFLTRSWLDDGGALLKKEVATAHVFAAKYLAQDINSTAVPSFTGVDELVETASDGRTVRRIGAGIDAGSYVSAPAGLVSFTTYGNAISIAKVQIEKIDKLNDQARAARNKSTTKKKKQA